jgi:hypothetical protein
MDLNATLLVITHILLPQPPPHSAVVALCVSPIYMHRAIHPRRDSVARHRIWQQQLAAVWEYAAAGNVASESTVFKRHSYWGFVTVNPAAFPPTLYFFLTVLNSAA